MTLIVPADILYLLAAPTAVEGFTRQGTPGNSWGNFCSTTPWSVTPYGNLFSDITGPENAAGQVDYACVFIWNNTLTGNAMQDTIAWLPTGLVTSGGATMTLGLDPTAASPLTGSTTPQAVGISSPTQAPSGVSAWAAASSTNAGGLSLGTIPPGYVKAVWVRRTATDSAPVTGDQFGLEIDFASNG